MPSYAFPPPYLISLPRETIDHIAGHLDKTSFLRLIRVSRAFTHLANDHRLWSSLSLCLPRHYAEHPSIEPIFAEDEEMFSWTVQQRVATRALCRSALKARVNAVLCRADEERWGRVQSIEFEPLPGTLFGMIQSLDFVSPSLRSMVIRGDLHYNSYEPRETFDVKLLEARISLPFLTSLHIGANANVSPAILVVVCNAALALKSVNVVFDRLEARSSLDEAVLVSPRYRSSTAVRIARIAMTGCAEADNDEVIAALVQFLASSPRLKQLSLPHDGLGLESAEAVITALAELPRLKDLHWPIDLAMWQDLADLASSRFCKLRRIILACKQRESWTALFGESIELQNLQKLYVDCSALDTSGTESKPEHGPTIHNMTPTFAEHLRDHPNLDTIHSLLEPIDHGDLDVFTRLDAIERSGNLGRLSSVKNGEEELLYAHFAFHLVEIADQPMEDLQLAYVILPYEGRDSEQRRKTFAESTHAVWQSLTSFDDLGVPLEIIEEMRVQAGISVEDWSRRGVVVGDDVWDILLDWHDKATRQVDETEDEDAESSENWVGPEKGCRNEECWAEDCWRGNLCYGRPYHYMDGCEEY